MSEPVWGDTIYVGTVIIFPISTSLLPWKKQKTDEYSIGESENPAMHANRRGREPESYILQQVVNIITVRPHALRWCPM